MTTKLHILDLYSVENVAGDPLKLILRFTNGTIRVDRHIVTGIILWMRANQLNGGYYSLDLGAYELEAARPYKNQHRTHKWRLESKLAMFKNWYVVNKAIKSAPNQYGSGGIVWYEDEPGIRVYREKNKDYSIQQSEFIKYAMGKQ